MFIYCAITIFDRGMDFLFFTLYFKIFISYIFSNSISVFYLVAIRYALWRMLDGM